MAEGLILEFNEGGEAEYRAVSAHLGIDVETGTGDCPTGSCPTPPARRATGPGW